MSKQQNKYSYVSVSSMLFSSTPLIPPPVNKPQRLLTISLEKDFISAECKMLRGISKKVTKTISAFDNDGVTCRAQQKKTAVMESGASRGVSCNDRNRHAVTVQTWHAVVKQFRNKLRQPEKLGRRC